jgi:hypothetical protein
LQHTSGRGGDVDVGIFSGACVVVETAEHAAAVAKSYAVELPMQSGRVRRAYHQKKQQTEVQKLRYAEA